MRFAPYIFPVTETRLWYIDLLLGARSSFFYCSLLTYLLQIRYYTIFLVVFDTLDVHLFPGPKTATASA